MLEALKIGMQCFYFMFLESSLPNYQNTLELLGGSYLPMKNFRIFKKLVQVLQN